MVGISVDSLGSVDEFLHEPEAIDAVGVDWFFAEMAGYLIDIFFDVFEWFFNADKADVVLVTADNHGDVFPEIVLVEADWAS